MEKRRKVIRAKDYIRKRGRVRNVTRGAIARHYVDMHGAGWVSSSPISEPPARPRVWLDADDRRARLMDMAREEQVVARADLYRLLGAGNGTMPMAELVELGIVAVPVDEKRVRLVGTSPDVARLGNRIHWARKLTTTALYVHETAINSLQPLLRVYEACARKLLGLNEPGTVIKLHRREPAISYLFYPAFFEEAHPALAGCIHVHLRDLKSTFRDYTSSENPPILHRKELFLDEDHPARPSFAELTKDEDAAGLFDSARAIGNRNGWQALLAAKSMKVERHFLQRLG